MSTQLLDITDLAECELHMEPPPCAPDHFVWHHPEVLDGAPTDEFGRWTTSSYLQETNCDVALFGFYLYGRKQWALRQDFDLILEQFSMAEHYDVLMSSSEESESDGEDGDTL